MRYSLYEQALKFYKQYGAWSEENLDRIDNKDIMAYGSILTWLKEQRKNKNLNKDMEECLSNIGFIIDTDKNIAEIRKVCTEYNIPYEDNKDILDNISAKELIIKIRYLLDNRIILAL
ncbi:unknown [Coprobacillus sp. CAG:605]|nr:unknown [Coprobacillus sp. CAG:605]